MKNLESCFIVGTLLTLLSSPTLANNYENTICQFPEPTFKSGFYIGGGLGLDLLRIRQNYQASIGGITLLTENPEVIAGGMEGSLLVGFDRYFKNTYYLGAEVFINDSNASTQRTMTDLAFTYNSKMNLNESYGVSLLPGYKLDATNLVFARLGFLRTHIKDNEKINFLTTTFVNSATRWTNGVTVGLGIERLIYGNLSLRGEYDYTIYQSFTNTFDYPSALGTQITTSKLTPVHNQLVLDFIYHL